MFISLKVGLIIQQCIIKLVRLEAFHLPLANNNDNALGTHLTHGLDCKLCPACAAGRAAAKESFEALWTDLSSIPALLYLGPTSGLLCIYSWISVHDTHRTIKLQEKSVPVATAQIPALCWGSKTAALNQMDIWGLNLAPWVLVICYPHNQIHLPDMLLWEFE